MSRYFWSRRPRRQSSTLSMKIANKLIEDGYLEGIPSHYCIRRTFAGHHQRSEGAWLWTLELVRNSDNSHPSYAIQCGSQWPAREIAKAFVAIWNRYGNLELWPEKIIDDSVK